MIYPYKAGSKGATALATSLGTKVIKTKGSSFKGSPDKIVINWGSSTLPQEVEKCTVINKAAALKNATNKLSFFKCVDGELQIPEYTTDKEVAHQWLKDGSLVVTRETLTGHSAEGLSIIETEAEWNGFPLNQVKMFVKYVPKKHEYRVHVVGDEVVDIQRKAASSNVPKHALNWKVRNLNNGFIFKREGVEEELSPQVKDQAIKAIKLTGLDFGAVDIIFNVYHNKAYVLEVNAAPGLEGSTPASYRKGFEKLFGKMEESTYKKRLSKDYGLDTVWQELKAAQVNFAEEAVVIDEPEIVDLPAPAFDWEAVEWEA